MRMVLFGVLLLGSLGKGSQPDCALDKHKEGIKVFICSTADDDLKSVRVEFLAKNATIAELEHIIDAVPNYINWQYQVIEASVLDRKGPAELVYRTRLAMPPFIDDREMIARLKKNRDPKVRRLDIEIATDPFPYPQSEDIVRVPASKTTWSIIEISQNSIHVTYTLSMDPGGTLPQWVVNEAMTVAPFETFKKLKQMLESD